MDIEAIREILVGKSPSEAVLHKHVAIALAQVLSPFVVWTTVEVSNQQGGKWAARNQGQLKEKGVKTGWPDIQLFWPHDDYTKGLCIELKKPGNKATHKQLLCHHELANANIPTVICHSWDEVEAALDMYEVPTILRR